MPINKLKNLEPEDLFIDSNKKIWKLIGIHTKPTVTLENVKTGERINGAIGCSNFDSFIKLIPENNLY